MCPLLAVSQYRYEYRKLYFHRSDSYHPSSKFRPMCRSLPWREVRETVLLPRTISRDGIRAAHESGIATRCRSLSFSTSLETVSPRLQYFAHALDTRRCKRALRLAHLARPCACPHCLFAATLSRR